MLKRISWALAIAAASVAIANAHEIRFNIPPSCPPAPPDLPDLPALF